MDVVKPLPLPKLATQQLTAFERLWIGALLRQHYEAGTTVPELAETTSTSVPYVLELLRHAETPMRPAATRLCNQCGVSPAGAIIAGVCRCCRKGGAGL